MASSTGSSRARRFLIDVYISPRVAPIAVVVAVVAALAPVPLWVGAVAVNVVVGIVLAFDIRGAPRADALGIKRIVPPVTAVDRETPVRLHARNPTSRPLRIEVRDATAPSANREPKVHRTWIPPGANGVLEATCAPSRRGTLAVGPVTVRIAGPLGMAGRQATVRLVDTVKVYPPLPGRADVELRVERARLLQVGQRSSRFRGGGTEFDSLREYHPDDAFRRINWAATARANKPITNLYREERNQQVVLLLDTSRTMAGTVNGLSRLEHALDAAIALAELAARVGDHVGMIAFASRVGAMLGPRGGRSQPQRILEILFDREPTLDAPNYREAFATLLSRHRRRSLLVLFTDVVEETAMESLFAALPGLVSRHLLIVAAVTDPEIVALRSSAPQSYEAAYLAAAAAGALSARERAAARLRSIGAMVEDRPPGQLAGAVADRYLQIKSVGRL
jgi:uncharacterized protein (DUF58 family)